MTCRPSTKIRERSSCLKERGPQRPAPCGGMCCHARLIATRTTWRCLAGWCFSRFVRFLNRHFECVSWGMTSSITPRSSRLGPDRTGLDWSSWFRQLRRVGSVRMCACLRISPPRIATSVPRKMPPGRMISRCRPTYKLTFNLSHNP